MFFVDELFGIAWIVKIRSLRIFRMDVYEFDLVALKIFLGDLFLSFEIKEAIASDGLMKT